MLEEGHYPRVDVIDSRPFQESVEIGLQVQRGGHSGTDVRQYRYGPRAMNRAISTERDRDTIR